MKPAPLTDVDAATVVCAVEAAVEPFTALVNHLLTLVEVQHRRLQVLEVDAAAQHRERAHLLAIVREHCVDEPVLPPTRLH